MQQQPPQLMNMVPQSTPITTEQIQKYLDENKTLILAILDNQNLGKLHECAQYQTLLQKNLMYLAAIADGQPQASAVPSQMPSHPAMQQGGHYMQHPQAAMSAQPGGFPPKSHMQFNPQQMQEQQRQQLQLQHQHALQGHMGIRSSVNNGLQGMHSEGNHGGSGSGVTTGAGAGAGAGVGASASARSPDAREGKQDGAEGVSGEGQRNSAGGNNNANGEPSQMKGSEGSK